jgi:hypothetical protein
VRDTVRGHGEKAAMELMGASPPENSADRQMFGDNFDAGGWKILCPVSCVPRLRLLKSVRLPPCNPVLPLCILHCRHHGLQYLAQRLPSHAWWSLASDV